MQLIFHVKTSSQLSKDRLGSGEGQFQLSCGFFIILFSQERVKPFFNLLCYQKLDFLQKLRENVSKRYISLKKNLVFKKADMRQRYKSIALY